MKTTSWWRRALPWAAVGLWAAVIFWFSAQDGTRSGGMSGSITARLAAILPGWNSLSPEKQAARVDFLHHLVRKGAHMSEYAVFGALLMNAWMRQRRCAGKRSAVLAAFCGLLYAASDEFHQLFVPGRAGLVTDVLIDFGGVWMGVLLFWAIYQLCSKCGSDSKKVQKYPL